MHGHDRNTQSELFLTAGELRPQGKFTDPNLQVLVRYVCMLVHGFSMCRTMVFPTANARSRLRRAKCLSIGRR